MIIIIIIIKCRDLIHPLFDYSNEKGSNTPINNKVYNKAIYIYILFLKDNLWTKVGVENTLHRNHSLPYRKVHQETLFPYNVP